MAKMTKNTKKIATPIEEVVETPTVETEEVIEEPKTKKAPKAEEVVVKTRANSGIDVN